MAKHLAFNQTYGGSIPPGPTNLEIVWKRNNAGYNQVVDGLSHKQTVEGSSPFPATNFV